MVLEGYIETTRTGVVRLPSRYCFHDLGEKSGRLIQDSPPSALRWIDHHTARILPFLRSVTIPTSTMRKRQEHTRYFGESAVSPSNHIHIRRCSLKNIRPRSSSSALRLSWDDLWTSLERCSCGNMFNSEILFSPSKNGRSTSISCGAISTWSAFMFQSRIL